MITVQVKSFIKEIIGKPYLEIEVEEGTTAKQLLIQLVQNQSPKVRNNLFNPETGEIYPHYMILINGKETFRLPWGIHTPLKSGDVVSILIFLAGG